MVTIKQIQLKSLKGISKFLEKNKIDLTLAEIGTNIKLEKSGGLMDFVIEKIGEDRVSFAFYGKQNGDVMRDPELTFVLNEQLKYRAKKGTFEKVLYLIPESFQNDYVGVCDEVFERDLKNKRVRFNPSGQQSIISLVKDMSNNILMRVNEL